MYSTRSRGNPLRKGKENTANQVEEQGLSALFGVCSSDDDLPGDGLRAGYGRLGRWIILRSRHPERQG